MRLSWTFALLVAGAAGLGGCSPADESAGSAEDTTAESAAAAQPATAYRTEVPMQILMRGPVTLAAEVYWESVSIVIDLEGVHENYPQSDEEWETVWAAAITLAESGNLLMMPGRALDQGDWMRLSNALVDVGLEAARAAEAQDFEAVLDVGEKVYNVCLECHQQYVPALPDL
jgi:hypothetical protein